MKLKVGDVVTILGNISFPSHYLAIGSTGVIKEITPTSYYVLGDSRKDPSRQVMQYVSFTNLTPYLTTASVEDCF